MQALHERRRGKDLDHHGLGAQVAEHPHERVPAFGRKAAERAVDVAAARRRPLGPEGRIDVEHAGAPRKFRVARRQGVAHGQHVAEVDADGTARGRGHAQDVGRGRVLGIFQEHGCRVAARVRQGGEEGFQGGKRRRRMEHHAPGPQPRRFLQERLHGEKRGVAAVGEGQVQGQVQVVAQAVVFFGQVVRTVGQAAFKFEQVQAHLVDAAGEQAAVGGRGVRPDAARGRDAPGKGRIAFF
ncbi:hypothetical protein DSECCO2_622800 [anaerobic digester metagenome]